MVPLLFFYKGGFGIKQPTKVDIPNQTKPKYSTKKLQWKIKKGVLIVIKHVQINQI